MSEKTKVVTVTVSVCVRVPAHVNPTEVALGDCGTITLKEGAAVGYEILDWETQSSELTEE